MFPYDSPPLHTIIELDVSRGHACTSVPDKCHSRHDVFTGYEPLSSTLVLNGCLFKSEIGQMKSGGMAGLPPPSNAAASSAAAAMLCRQSAFTAWRPSRGIGCRGEGHLRGADRGGQLVDGVAGAQRPVFNGCINRRKIEPGPTVETMQ